MKVYVLRLGHRVQRDHRVTTHCALVARAFGADGLFFTGDRDTSIIISVQDIINRWGGPFEIAYIPNWRVWLKKKVRDGFEVTHLTMYGRPVNKVINNIKRSKKDKLIIIGAEKVPGEVYEIARHNVSITLQPHSEVAALAVFLDRLFNGKELEKKFTTPELVIMPQVRGKKVKRVGKK